MMIVGAVSQKRLVTKLKLESLGKLFGTGAGAKVSIVLLTSALFALGITPTWGFLG